MRGFIAKAILLGLATASFADNPTQAADPANKSSISPPVRPSEPIPAAKKAIDKSPLSKDGSAPKAKGLIGHWTSMKKVFSADENETLSVEADPAPIQTPPATHARSAQSSPESTLTSISQAEPLPAGDAPAASTTINDIAMSPEETNQIIQAPAATSDIPMSPTETTIESTTASAIPAAPAGYGWYGRLDFVYWTATDPKPVGSAFNSYPGAPTAPLTPTSEPSERIRIDDPNTDHEMGFRQWIGAHSRDRLAFEWGALWVNPSSYLEQLNSRPASVGAFGSTPAETVRIAFTNEPVDFANMSWRNRFWGTEVNGRYHAVEGPIWYLDTIMGLRYFQYDERLVFEYDRDFGGTAPTIRRERFNTGNHLVGPQLGGDVKLRLFEYVTWETMGRACLMANIQNLDVTGPTPGEGRFTNASNLGSRSTTDFSPILELTSGVVLELTPAITFQAGYTIMWIGNLLRATEQVDLGRIGGSPVVPMANDDIWIRGFTGSITYRW